MHNVGNIGQLHMNIWFRDMCSHVGLGAYLLMLVLTLYRGNYHTAVDAILYPLVYERKDMKEK